jgi:alpha-N-arabinofuranosidase
MLRWDETKAPGSVGLEQKYEYVDMLGVCAWLNLLVRKHKDVGIACIAQSVNVVSPFADLNGGV